MCYRKNDTLIVTHFLSATLWQEMKKYPRILCPKSKGDQIVSAS